MSSAPNNPFTPTDRMLRQFSGLWIVFLGAIAVFQQVYHQRHVLAIMLAVLAVTLGPIGLARPRVIKPLYLLLMLVTFPIGWVISNVVLLVIFILLITPLAVWFRIIGRDELRCKRASRSSSFWIPCGGPQDVSTYYRQF